QDIKEKTYPEVLEEPRLPPGVKIIVRNGLVENFNDELINMISETSGKSDSPVYQIRSVGGAMKRINSDSTAFPYRNSEAMIIVVNFLPLDASQSLISNAMILWKKIQAFTIGAYVNFLSTVSDEEVAAIYPEKTYTRLAKIKSKYDPLNIFNRNYNIKPDNGK
ncbi:MAG: BBE domain-containing protein, partial [Ignavibacteria bacterium]